MNDPKKGPMHLLGCRITHESPWTCEKGTVGCVVSDHLKNIKDDFRTLLEARESLGTPRDMFTVNDEHFTHAASCSTSYFGSFTSTALAPTSTVRPSACRSCPDVSRRSLTKPSPNQARSATTTRRINALFKANITRITRDDGRSPPAPLGPNELRACWCYECLDQPEHGLQNPTVSTFIVCPACWDKRCPRATNHRYACTGSNEPGQFGSNYGPLPTEADMLRDETAMPTGHTDADVLQAFRDVSSGAVTNLSFSAADVVMVTKGYFAALGDGPDDNRQTKFEPGVNLALEVAATFVERDGGSFGTAAAEAIRGLLSPASCPKGPPGPHDEWHCGYLTRVCEEGPKQCPARERDGVDGVQCELPWGHAGGHACPSAIEQAFGRRVEKPAMAVCAWYDEDEDAETDAMGKPRKCTRTATHYSCCYDLSPCVNVCSEHRCRCKGPLDVPA
jgi:hypothetical protein